MKPNGMMPAARAAKTAICFGMKSPSASGKIPADNAKSSAPRLSAQSRGWARAISAMRKNAAAVSTIAMKRRRARRDTALGFDLVDNLGEQPYMLGAIHFGEGQGQHPGA